MLSFARLNYKTMSFHGGKAWHHLSLKFIYRDGKKRTKQKQRREDTGTLRRRKEKGERMKSNWSSTDGLSSEVRLNRTEVNNGYLVKGRSSQSGSYFKKRRKKNGKKNKTKTASNLSKGKLPNSICLSMQHTLSPAITTYQPPGFFSPHNLLKFYGERCA